MSLDDETDDRRREIALFRESILDQLDGEERARGDLSARIAELATRRFETPLGKLRSFTERTLWSWWSAYKQHGLLGLLPKLRSDKGVSREITPEILEAAIKGLVVERLQALVHARSLLLDQLPLHVIVEHPVRLPDNFDRLAATLALHQPGLLLLDPLIRLHRADENSASEMSVILDGLRDLARSSRTAILLVHHSRKAAAGPSLGTALRGSSDLHAFGDSNLYLRRLAQDAGLELRIEHRVAASPPPLRLKLTIDGHAARFQATELHAQDHPHARRILELLHGAAEPVPSSVLRNKLGVRNQTLSEVLAMLAAQGQVVRRGNSGWAVASASV